MNITLLDGRTLQRSDISFDPATQRFYLDVEEITWQITARDKEANFVGFDQAKTNELAYADKYRRENAGADPTATGSTSTLGIFTEQILTEPLKAPIAALDKGVQQIFASTGVKTVGTILTVGLIVYAGYLLSRK